MRRRRQTPWIQRWSRPAIAGTAAVGALITGYLTFSKLVLGSTACPTEGCDTVLNSPYAYAFGIPLTVFGLLAYLAMGSFAVAPLLVGGDRKQLRLDLERWTGTLLLLGGTAMAVFSSYLMYLLAFEIQEFCLYCFASAAFSASFLALSALGRDWEDPGQAAFSSFIVAAIVGVGVLGLYAATNGNLGSNASSGDGQLPPVVTTVSTADADALATHLTATGAKEYGAYWCPHCHDQKQLFGKSAAAKLNYIECDPNGANSQTDLCRQVGITSFPTWEIDRKLYPGVQPLDQLADLSGYGGSRDFQVSAP